MEFTTDWFYLLHYTFFYIRYIKTINNNILQRSNVEGCSALKFFVSTHCGSTRKQQKQFTVTLTLSQGHDLDRP